MSLESVTPQILIQNIQNENAAAVSMILADDNGPQGGVFAIREAEEGAAEAIIEALVEREDEIQASIHHKEWQLETNLDELLYHAVSQNPSLLHWQMYPHIDGDIYIMLISGPEGASSMQTMLECL